MKLWELVFLVEDPHLKVKRENNVPLWHAAGGRAGVGLFGVMCAFVQAVTLAAVQDNGFDFLDGRYNGKWEGF